MKGCDMQSAFECGLDNSLSFPTRGCRVRDVSGPKRPAQRGRPFLLSTSAEPPRAQLNHSKQPYSRENRTISLDHEKTGRE
jgi:hypothetical protein